MKRYTAGTRGSALARAQTGLLIEHLQEAQGTIAIEEQIISTKGDKILDSPLSQIPGKGLFTRELEKALLDGTIDFAVHSLKDLPAELPPGLVLGAFLEREKTEDVLISKNSRTLDQLPPGAVIGTGSNRRRLQLQRMRPDLTFTDIRGNIDTRIKKAETESGLDGIILAYAGLKRLGLTGKISQELPREELMPAPGQGIIAVECRDESPVLQLLASVNHTNSMYEALAERSLLACMGGGCQTPLACLTTVREGVLTLKARYMDGPVWNEAQVSLPVTCQADAVRAGKEAGRLVLGN